MTTPFTLQNESSAPSYTLQSRTTTAFTLQNRDRGESLLLTEDGGHLLSESGDGIILDQAVVGDGWALQNKS